MLRKFLFVVLLIGGVVPAIADTECPMGWGYTTLVDASAGGCVDLGTLLWYRSEYYQVEGVYPFVAMVSDMKPGTNTHIAYCERYANGTREDKKMSTNNAQLWGSEYHMVAIWDKNYSDTTAFRQAMSGVILYYQRATDESWTPPQDDTVCQFDTSSYEPYGEYTLPEIYGCTLCPPNTYKDTVGNTECTPCPDGTLSPAGAKSIDQCGHILHVGNYNIFMPVGRRTEHGLCAMLDGVKYCADVYERE